MELSPRVTCSRRRLVALALALAVAVAASSTACSALFNWDRYAGDPGNTDGAGEPGDAAVDTLVPDAGDEGARDGASSADCPGHAGPAGVRIGAFCIDSTEVTNAQYRDFYAAADSDAGRGIPECAWNDSIRPNYGWPPMASELDLPVVGVDWCDARAYCAWAGKRLCGRIGGSAANIAEANDATFDQWYRACSAGGVRPYPYGDAYDPSKCNGQSGKRASVGTDPSCVGGYPGIFDMSGNVAEWEDLCEPAPDGGGPQADACRARGGGANDSAAVLACGSSFTGRRDYAIALIGFRCCAP